MSEQEHPLYKKESWIFNQPDVGVRAHYLAIEHEVDKPRKTVLTVESASTCREGVIQNLRQVFQKRLTNLDAVNESQVGGWDSSRKKTDWVMTRTCDLESLTAKKEPTELKIHWHKNWLKEMGPDFPIEKFLQVCDRVLGPIAVLLGPYRPEGDKWWRTDPEKAVRMAGENKYVYWQGSDNWFLFHPATLGIALGLYRQCFHLCGAGVADEIIKSVSEDEISEVMSANSQKQALLLLKKMRMWVEVPLGTNGFVQNYAFPFGFWRRLIRLQRAIRRHGYEEALGQTFEEGWALTGGISFHGTYSFWGEEENTNHHEHLMEMGAPRRKASVKSAKKAT